MLSPSKTNGLFEYVTFGNTVYINFRGYMYRVRDLRTVGDLITCSNCLYGVDRKCIHPIREYIYSIKNTGKINGVRNSLMYCNSSHHLGVRKEEIL